MAAIALGLPPTGLIVCLGEFLRRMGNVSNIYCRVLASSDIHCINLTWPLRRQKAGLWEVRFLEYRLGETEVWVGIWNNRYKREERAAMLSFDLCCFTFSRKSGRGLQVCTGELCVCVCVCVHPLACNHICLCMSVDVASCRHAFFSSVCVCMYACACALPLRVCFCLKLRVLFVEWSSGAHSDRWCKLLIAFLLLSVVGLVLLLSLPSISLAYSLCLFPSSSFLSLDQVLLWTISLISLSKLLTSFLFHMLFSCPISAISTWVSINVGQNRKKSQKRLKEQRAKNGVCHNQRWISLAHEMLWVWCKYFTCITSSAL